MAHLFFKLLRTGWRHFDYQYVLGENVYTGRFDDDSEKNGFFFCTRTDLPHWLQLHDDFESVAEVHLFEYSEVHMFRHKFKTNCLRLENPVALQTFLDENYGGDYLIRCKAENIRFVGEAMIQNEMRRYMDTVKGKHHLGKGWETSEYELFVHTRNMAMDELTLEAVRRDGTLLQWALRQTVPICLAAVQQNGLALQYCKFQAEEVIEAALRQNGMAIGWVKQKTPALCEIAVRQNGFALCYINDQTEEICKVAIRQNPLAIQYVRNQTIGLAALALQLYPKGHYMIRPDILELFERGMRLRSGRLINTILMR